MKHVHIERVENGWIITGKDQPENGVYVVAGKVFVFNEICALVSELPTILSVEQPDMAPPEPGLKRLCCVCKEKPSESHFTQIVGGKLQHLDLCEECAEEKGLNDLSLSDILLGRVTPLTPEST